MNVTVSAKKILVERVLNDPCKQTLVSRLESTNPSQRLEALTVLRYVFDFKNKTKSSPPQSCDYTDRRLSR